MDWQIKGDFVILLTREYYVRPLCQNNLGQRSGVWGCDHQWRRCTTNYSMQMGIHPPMGQGPFYRVYHDQCQVRDDSQETCIQVSLQKETVLGSSRWVLRREGWREKEVPQGGHRVRSCIHTSIPLVVLQPCTWWRNWCFSDMQPLQGINTYSWCTYAGFHSLGRLRGKRHKGKNLPWTAIELLQITTFSFASQKDWK